MASSFRKPSLITKYLVTFFAIFFFLSLILGIAPVPYTPSRVLVIYILVMSSV